MSAISRARRLLDCHFHWYPQEVEEGLNRARGTSVHHSPEWYDLDAQLERMDALGCQVDVISSTGPFTGLFTNIDADQSRALTRLYNETMAEGQRRYPGRVWGTCVLPLPETDAALAAVDYAVEAVGRVGGDLPGRIGDTGTLDHPRPEPASDGSEGVSVSAYRLVRSGLMERHPDLKVIVSHTGGALPYQAGRMDKNSGAAGLPKPPTEYLRRMYTDTVSPHTAGVRFAIEFYGPDRVM